MTLLAKAVRFDSIALVEGTAELKECEIKNLAVGPSRVKATLHVAEKTRIAVSMGSAEVNVLTLEGDMDVSTVMGSLVLRLPEDCDATIEVAGEGGEVVLNSGRLLGSGEHRIQITNVRGAVIVDL
ncbi:hypothetical protein [Thermococcus sp.]